MADEPESEAKIRLAAYKILGPVISSVGILGNVLILLVLWFRKWKADKHGNNSGGLNSYMYIFLCGLAIADLGYLIFNLQACYYLSDTTRWEDDDNFSYAYVRRVMQPTWNAFKATSDFIVISMTIDRYRVISNIEAVRLFAMRSDEVVNAIPWSVYLQIAGAFLFSFGLHAPQYFKIECNGNLDQTSEEGLSDEEDMTTTEQPTWECLVQSDSDLWMVYNIIYYTFVKIVPVIIVVGLNLILAKKLRIIYGRRRKVLNGRRAGNNFRDTTIGDSSVIPIGQDREHHQNRRKTWSVTSSISLREQRLAYLLLSLAVSFVVLTLPANIVFIYFIANDGKASVMLTTISNLLESLNYCLNFYVYCAVHKEIRDCFVELISTIFRCKWKVENNESNIT